MVLECDAKGDWGWVVKLQSVEVDSANPRPGANKKN